MAYTTGTLTGHYVRLDGTPATGSVLVVPSAPVLRDAEGDVILSGPVSVQLVDGSFSVDLPAGDDQGLDPTGVTYSVEARLHHMNMGRVQGITITAGQTVDMADVTTLDPTAPTYAEFVNDAQVAAGEAEVSAAAADTSATSAAASADQAETFAAGTVALQDAAASALIGDEASQTRGALSATLVARTASPRGGQRATLERRPQFQVVKSFPNQLADHKLLYASDTDMWAIGHDFALRRSADHGATWSAKFATTGGVDMYGKDGLFFKTASGVYLTTSHPVAGGAPKLLRSVDGGATWTQVVAAQANVEYLGPTSICQDPITGYLYLAEYVTVSAATKPTWKISRCTDGNGAAWTTFHTFQRDAAANPATAVRHGHSIQWDPVGQRIYFLCGDSEQAAGLYRVNDAGTDVEAVVTNAELDTANGFYGGAVGVMFFPNFIAWGVDQVSDSGLVRMNRDQIGAPAPVVERVAELQTTAFYTARLASDNTEWLMTTSDEDGGGGRLDQGCHIYRVADDGSTCDEVASFPTERADSFSWMYPLGGDPLAERADGMVWFGTTTPVRVEAVDPKIHGFQFAGRLLWSNGPTLQLPRPATYRPFYLQESAHFRGDLTALQKTIFAVEECPIGPSRLYILNTHREQFSGAGGFFYVEVGTYTAADASDFTLLKMEDGVTDMRWQYRSRRTTMQEATASWIARSALLSPGTKIAFRVNEVLNNTASGVAGVTYAWGF